MAGAAPTCRSTSAVGVVDSPAPGTYSNCRYRRASNQKSKWEQSEYKLERFRFHQRDHQSAENNQAPAYKDSGGWLLAEGEEIYQLRDEEEENDVDAQQPSEVPGRGIDRIAVAKENQPAQNHQRHFLHCRSMQAGAHQGVTARFQQCSQEQNQQSGRGIHRVKSSW